MKNLLKPANILFALLLASTGYLAHANMHLRTEVSSLEREIESIKTPTATPAQNY